MVLCLIRNARCILQAPGFRTALSRDWVFSQMEFIPPLSERKRNATPDRWMTDESFPFMRLRMLTLICCHVSPWLKCVCVYELVWERQKSEKKEEREGESAMMRFWLHYSSRHQIFHWGGPTRRPPFIQPASPSFHPALQRGRCVSRKEHSSPRLFRMRDYFAPFTNVKKGEEVCLCNMKLG